MTGTNQSSTERRTARATVLNYLSLFTSFGTLLCCALPSLLVLLGLGATVASFLSAVPWLVTVSRHKNWVFACFRGAHCREHSSIPTLSPRAFARRAERAQWMRRTACEAATNDEPRDPLDIGCYLLYGLIQRICVGAASHAVWRLSSIRPAARRMRMQARARSASEVEPSLASAVGLSCCPVCL